MGIFDNLKSEGLEEAQDRVGGYQTYKSDIYLAKIKFAYAATATHSNSRSLNLILELPTGEYRESLWVANKDGQNWFTRNDKKIPLQGFTIADDICQMTIGKALSEMDSEDKVINVYDPDAKKELPKSVPMLTELLGKEIYVAILEESVWKQAKDNNGVYQDTNEERLTNSIDKVFHNPSRMTVPEAKAGLGKPEFYDKWLEANKGKTKDRKKSPAGAPPQAGGNKPAPQAGGSKGSLFSK